MKKDDIMEKLKELGVEFDSRMKKDELQELLDESLAKAEAQKPKKYVVISDFKDLQDKGYVYIKDDPYPREGNKNVTQERIEELLSNKNKQGKPLIKEQD